MLLDLLLIVVGMLVVYYIIIQIDKFSDRRYLNKLRKGGRTINLAEACEIIDKGENLLIFNYRKSNLGQLWVLAKDKEWSEPTSDIDIAVHGLLVDEFISDEKLNELKNKYKESDLIRILESDELC